MASKRSLLFIVVTLLIACSQSNFVSTTPSVSTTNIISLKDHLPTLYEEAKRWHPDAYLRNVDIPIQRKQSNLWLISANFQSPSDDHESLAVNLWQDGKLTTEPFKHEASVYQTQPIKNEDWPIDSQDALNLLLDDDGINFLQTHAIHCSALNLERDLAQTSEPVIWILTLSSCGRGDTTHIFLDPITKETGIYTK